MSASEEDVPLVALSPRRHSSVGTTLLNRESETATFPDGHFSVPTRFFSSNSSATRRVVRPSPILQNFQKIAKAALEASLVDQASNDKASDTELPKRSGLEIRRGRSFDVKIDESTAETSANLEGISGLKREPRAPRILSERRATTAHALTERAMAVSSNSLSQNNDVPEQSALPENKSNASSAMARKSLSKPVEGIAAKTQKTRAVSIDVIAPYVVDTSEQAVFLAWQNGAISLYSQLVSITLWTLRFVWWYTALSVPFELCFLNSSEVHNFIIACDMALDVIFVGCVLVLLFTAVSLKGESITDRPTLIRMYARSSLVTDLISVLPFFLDAYLMSLNITTTSTTRLLRSVRISRLLSKRQHDMSENGLFGLVAMSMFVAHLVACGYVAFSILGTNESDGWKMEPDLFNESLVLQYLHALTWSLDIMTGFRETYTPQSDLQYLFTMLTFLTGTFLFAYVIGRTGDWVSRRTARKENLDLRLTITEQFIENHDIPDALAHDLVEFYRYTWESMRGFDATSVLNTLPVCIGVDVSSFIYRTHLSKVEFFERMPASVVSELAKRMGMVVRSPGEKIMVEGQAPFGICFVNFGVVDVISRRGTRLHSLRRGEMFGDEILRSQAVVSNSYIARTFCQLYVLETSDVASVLAAFPVEAAFMAKMAKGKGNHNRRNSNSEKPGTKSWFRLPLFSYRSNLAVSISLAQDAIALYNAFVVLLRIGFNIEGPVLIFLLSMDVLVDFGAVLCIVARFHEQSALYGELITSRKAIAKKYLRGYFALDLITLLPLHWIEIYNPVFRLQRLLGMIRYFFAKKRLIANSTLLKLSRQIITFTLITHFVSCLYFAVAKIEGYSDYDEDFLPGPNAQHANLFIQYSIATLHSLKILTGRGNKPIGLPHSVLQLIFLIVSSMLGMFGVAFLIGEISVLVAHFNPLRFIHQVDVDNINHFMHYKKFPISLQRRVRSYLAYRWECTQGIGLKEAIADLPRALRIRVLEHITLRFVRQVPMFSNLSEPLIQSILECFEYMCVPAHEYVYRKSEMGNNMYIILEGVVALGHSGHDPVLMGPGSFFGEEAILNKIGLRDTSVQTFTGCTLGTLTADALENALESFNEEEHVKVLDELASHQDGASKNCNDDHKLMETLDCLIRDNFFLMSAESPVSMNLHTGKEIMAFIRKELKCKDNEASDLIDKLLANGNLRPLGILSPTTHVSALKARSDAVSDTTASPNKNEKSDFSCLYRLIDFRIEIGEPVEDDLAGTTNTANNQTPQGQDTKDRPRKQSRSSLNRSQALLLKTSSGNFNLSK